MAFIYTESFAPVSTLEQPLAKRIFQHIQAKRQLSLVLNSIDSDVIHFHDLDTAVISLFNEMSKPWVYDARRLFRHDIDLTQPLPTVATLLERYVVSKSDGIITVSPSIMKRLASYGAKRRLMIFNSRTTEHFHQMFHHTNFVKNLV